MSAEIRQGDCVELMCAMLDESVDAVVTDPPYGIGFMGHEWDQPGKFSAVKANGTPANRRFQAWCEEWGSEALRVLKPGGYAVVFGGARTAHRLAAGLEDAGFEIRDTIMWLFGSGFPKSLDVAKAIDKAARGVPQGGSDPTSANHGRFKTQATEGSRGDGDAGRGYGAGPGQFMAEAGEWGDRELVAEAQLWDGWGTALKPAHEPIVVARKPLVGTVAGNVLEHGTAALNIDGCRVGMSNVDRERTAARNRHSEWGSGPRENAVYGEDKRARGEGGDWNPEGRWPANVVLSHDEDCVLVGRREVRANGHSPAARGPSGYGSAVEDSNGGGLKGQDGLEERRFDGELVEVWACVSGCPVRMLDDQTGDLGRSAGGRIGNAGGGAVANVPTGAFAAGDPGFGDRGGASRFFYCAKASRAERNAGLDGMPESSPWTSFDGQYAEGRDPATGERTGRYKREQSNSHPTVKPIDLMRWLVRLVTPPGGVVLDPFAGSGTTGCAAALEGFGFVGCEREAGYVEIAQARVRFWAEHPTGLPAEVALEAEARRRRARESGQLGLDLA